MMKITTTARALKALLAAALAFGFLLGWFANDATAHAPNVKAKCGRLVGTWDGTQVVGLGRGYVVASRPSRGRRSAP